MLDAVDDVPSYEWLEAVKPFEGCFDVVSVDNRYSFYVDDCGLLNGSPYNYIASKLSGRNLCGNVLVLGMCDSEGETHSFSGPMPLVDLLSLSGKVFDK